MSILERDSFTGTEQNFYYEPIEDSYLIVNEQDVEPVVERNKAIQQHETSGWKGDWHLVGSIPAVVMEDLHRKGILYDRKAMTKWLNDSDNRAFRTKVGHL